MTETLQVNRAETLPSILGALGILVLGWIVALVVRAGVRKGLGLIKINRRLRSTTGVEVDIEGEVAAGIYYLILLLVLMGFFHALHLELVSGPLLWRWPYHSGLEAESLSANKWIIGLLNDAASAEGHFKSPWPFTRAVRILVS